MHLCKVGGKDQKRNRKKLDKIEKKLKTKNQRNRKELK
jgi:hypothetical protein